MNATIEHLVNSASPISIQSRGAGASSPALSAGDILPGVQICPVGDWMNGKSNQHCSLEALNRVVDEWRAAGSKDILVDFEHKSEEGGTSDTSAAAWVSNVRVDPERGLVGDFTFTDVGAEAVTNRRLRFLSVGWYVNRESREPMKITSIALTNKPNIPVDPILNKDEPDPTTVEDTKEKSMDKIKAALGLASEATEDDVLNAVNAMIKAKADADAEALNKEAEEFAEANAKKCNKEVLKAQYLANKEVAKAIVDAMPEPKTEPQQVLNKSDAKVPVKEDLIKELNKLPAGKDRVTFITQHAAEFAAAAE